MPSPGSCCLCEKMVELQGNSLIPSLEKVQILLGGALVLVALPVGVQCQQPQAQWLSPVLLPCTCQVPGPAVW